MSQIVFDIGGSNMRVASVENGQLGAIERVKTPRDPQEAVERLAELAARVGADPISGMIGGIIGVIRADGRLSAPPHIQEWEGFRFEACLSERVKAPIRVVNDNQLAALGEARCGAGVGARIVAQLGIGTGVGGARIVRGEIDANALGFEPGHSIITASSWETLEMSIGGAEVARTYGKPAQSLDRGTHAYLTRKLAAGIWNLLIYWSPDIVVLTGSLMNEETGFRIAEVVEAVNVLHEKIGVIPIVPPIKRGALGDDAGLIGAACLFE